MHVFYKVSNDYRLSLQTGDKNADKHLYENREQALVHGRHYSSDLTVPHNSARRASFDDGVFMPHKTDTSDTRQATPLREDDTLYQNVTTKTFQSNRTSPTKKTHLSAISVPVPEGYYALTPPPLVRQHHSSNASPSSSPEDGSFHDQIAYLVAETNKESESDKNIYANANQELSMAIIGDSLIVNKLSQQRFKALSPSSETPDAGGVYQNLEFMRGPGVDQSSKRYWSINTVECILKVSLSYTVFSEDVPTIPATISEELWSPHNYTNVDFAQASAQGQATSKSKNIRSRKPRM